MADTRRDFEEYARSGEIIEIFIGGTEEEHRVATLGDLDVINAKSSIRQIAPQSYTLQENVWTTFEFDQIGINRGDIVGNIVDDYITTVSDKPIEIKVGINADFPQFEEAILTLFKNGVEAINGFQTNYQGMGDNKPILMYWYASIDAAAGDVFEVKVSSITGNLSFDVLHAFFEIKEDN